MHTVRMKRVDLWPNPAHPPGTADPQKTLRFPSGVALSALGREAKCLSCDDPPGILALSGIAVGAHGGVDGLLVTALIAALLALHACMVSPLCLPPRTHPKHEQHHASRQARPQQPPSRQ